MIRGGADPNPEWPRRSLAVHTTMCAFMESANSSGNAVTLRSDGVREASGRLAGKTCVVLGGTGNIGAGVALAYAEEGANVIITGRSQVHDPLCMYRYICRVTHTVNFSVFYELTPEILTHDHL